MVRGRCIRGRCIGLDLRVDGNSLVRDISDISIVVVSSVLDVLGSAVRKSNRVRSNNSAISISRFSSLESSLGVIIRNSIGVGVWFRGLLLLVVGGRGVIRCRGVIRSRGGMDNRGSIRSRGSMDNRGSIRSSMVDNGGSLVGSSMDNRGSMVGSSMDNRGSMVGSGMVRSWSISRILGNSSWGMNSSSIFLSVMVSINSLRSSMGLAHNRCNASKVRFEH